MVSKGVLILSCHGLVWVGAIALALWAGGARAAMRYDTATPYAPPYNKYKYIPLHGNDNGYESSDFMQPPMEKTEMEEPTGAPVSEFILSALRTALEVIRNMNKQRSAASVSSANTTAVMPRRHSVRANNTTVVTGRVLEESNEGVISGRALDESNSTGMVSGRGFEDYYDDHHHETTTPKPMKPRYTDPWAGYYDWIINEGSFKFWSVFQLFTAALLLYACLSAIYYAKFNPILPDYSMEYDDYFLERTVGRQARSLEPSEMPSGHSWINPRTFQFILDAISKHYENNS